MSYAVVKVGGFYVILEIKVFALLCHCQKNKLLNNLQEYNLLAANKIDDYFSAKYTVRALSFFYIE